MRLISLCPSTTKLVFDLGLGDALVGITKYCIHPADMVGEIEKMGGTKDPDLDRIVAAEPDLVLLNEEENRLEDYESLKARGIRCHTGMPVDVPSTLAYVEALAEMLGVVDAGQKHRAEICRALDEVRALFPEPLSCSWAYLIWRKPYMSVGCRTYIHGLISEVAGPNVFADFDADYPVIDADLLREADPRLVMLSSEPFPFKQKHIDELSELTGLPKMRFRIVDGESFSWHGAYTARGLREAAALFKDVTC